MLLACPTLDVTGIFLSTAHLKTDERVGECSDHNRKRQLNDIILIECLDPCQISQ
jgi:hypothetical protein